MAASEREFVDAQRAAYLETMIEDDEIAEGMDAGRLGLHRRGVSDAGPYQSPLEDGMRHFHAWYRRALDGGGNDSVRATKSCWQRVSARRYANRGRAPGARSESASQAEPATALPPAAERRAYP